MILFIMSHKHKRGDIVSKIKDRLFFNVFHVSTRCSCYVVKSFMDIRRNTKIMFYYNNLHVIKNWTKLNDINQLWHDDALHDIFITQGNKYHTRLQPSRVTWVT